MAAATIDDELRFVGEKYLERYPSLGAVPLDDEEKMRVGVRYLKDTLCPQLERVEALLSTLPAQIGGTVLDVILCVALEIEVPPLKVAELIARVGVRAFCLDPNIVRQKPA
jgi:hypothetical protein